MAEDKRLSTTEEVIEKKKEELCDEIKATQATSQACNTMNDAGLDDQQYKTCCYMKAQDLFDFYCNLDLCYAIGARKDAEIIKDNTKKYLDKDKELGNKLGMLVKSMKETKGKMELVVDEACKLSRCLKEEERCNPDILKALNNGIENFDEEISNLESKVKECYEKICQCFEIGINVTGIQTFTNIESLQQIGTQLAGSVNNFHNNVKDRTQKSNEEIKTAKEDLAKVIQEASALKFEKCREQIINESACDTRTFICDPDCKDPEQLNDICDKVKKNFNDRDDDRDCECDDKKDQYSKRQKKRKDEEWSIKE